MKPNCRSWLILFINLFSAYFAQAQEWRWYRSPNFPLPSNNVNSLVVGKNNVVFATTPSGLTKFEDDLWQQVPVGNLGNPQLKRVWTYSDSLWVGTEYNGLWGRINGVWINYDPNTSGNGVVGFGKSSKDSLYRLDKFQRFDRWNGTDWSRILSFVDRPENLFVDRHDFVWVLSGNLGMYQYRNDTIIHWRGNISPGSPYYIPSGSIYDMIQDRNGIYWIASGNGLLRFDGTNFQVYNTQNSGIVSNETRCVAIDKVDNLWIGTRNGGVSKFNGTTWQTYNVINSPLTSLLVNDIVVDTLNRIWIANGYNELVFPSGGQGIFFLDESVDFSNGILPAAPTGLSATIISVNEVRLTWVDRSNNEAGFVLERSTGDSLNFHPIKTFIPNTTNFTDLTVTGSTDYYYRIKATNSQGSSAYSRVIRARPQYCQVNSFNESGYADIRKVVFGNIFNATIGCTGVSYEFQDSVMSIYGGQTIMLTVGIDRCNITSDPWLAGTAYIDWNCDGDFTDAGEMVFNNNRINGKGEFNIPVTVPGNVIPGSTTRLRIRSEDNESPNSIPPCGYSKETQDYGLIISSSSILLTQPYNPSTSNISSRAMTLQWQDNSSAETGYLIERSTDSITFTSIGAIPPNTITFKDSLLEPDTKYYYRITTQPGAGYTSSVGVVGTTLSVDLIRQWNGDVGNLQAFSSGAFWNDFNNDGKNDLFVTGIDRLYTNQDTVLNNSGIVFSASATATWADYDNDGDQDVYLTDNLYNGGSPPPRFYENNGNGSFTSSSPFTPDGRIYNVVWTDYNNDGFLDLYVSYLDLSYGKMYRNNGNKTFSFAFRLNHIPYYASCADFDNDGDDDLIMFGSGQTLVFEKRDSVFTARSVSGLALFSESARGASWGDYDNDGDLDVVVPNTSSSSFSILYRNLSPGSFWPQFLTTSPDFNGSAYGSSWGDFDNDGFLDLFVSRFQKTNKLLRNKNGAFVEMPFSIYQDENFIGFPFNEMSSMGTAWADYNNDGFLDLFVAVSGSFSRLYKNGTNNNKWLKVKLKGTVANANGIGSKIKIKVNGSWQYRWVQSNSGFSAQNSLEEEFGLKTASSVDSLVVYWPSGNLQVLKNVAANQTITITEVPNKRFWLGTVDNSWHNALNWSSGVIPDEITDVIINSITPFQCTISQPAVCRSLTLSNGITLVANNNLVITGK